MNKNTKYKLIQLVERKTKTIMLDREKVLRFSPSIRAWHFKLNEKNEIEISVDEDPNTFILTEYMNEMYVDLLSATKK